MSQEISNLNFPALVNKSIKQIANALPNHISPERMARISITAWRKNPNLQKCKPLSILSCVIQAAQLGLEPDLLGRAYLVPYKDECQLIPGWRGLVDLCNRTGNASVWTGAVFEGDKFDYALGSAPFVNHVPGGESDPKKLLHVYACGKIKGIDQVIIESWPVNRVWTHRDEYNKVGKKHYSFSNQEMYARKVVLLQVLKYLPASVEMDMAMQLNNSSEMGKQNISMGDAIQGTWIPSDDDTNAAVNQAKDITPPQTKTKPAEKPQQQAPHKFTLPEILQMIKDANSQDEIDLAIDVMDELTSDEKNKITLAASARAKWLTQQK